MSNSLYSGNFLRIDQLDNGIVELCLDNCNAPVNTLSVEFREELRDALSTLKNDGIKGLLLSSAKSGFLAGANIDELETLLAKSSAEQIEFCENTAAVLCRLEDLPFPSVCAISGFALGGGLEVALCTDYRVATDSALLGFPEVGLGVLPGVGGTVKTPRLAGFETGLEWLSSGRQYSGKLALSAGMIDETSDESSLRARSLALLDEAINGKLDWQQRRVQRKGIVELNTEALDSSFAKFKRGAKHYPAANAICELLQRCAPLDRDAALKQEAACFSQLAQSTTAKALVAVYQAQQSLKKKNKSYANKEVISKAGVLGAGIMGGGIAYTTALRGTPVIMKDIQQSAVDLGLNEARKLLGKQVSQQRISQDKADTILTSILGQLDFSDFDSLDIIAEAVVEKLEIKQAVLSETAKHSRPDTVLASNTSSLRISDIAAGLENPAQLVGMHFFNPVHMMPLVEVVIGPQSSDQAVAKTIAYALQMGKTPLLVKDCSGFLINRILGAYFAAFSLLVREGVDFQRIDNIMTAWGLPMGPAYLLDVAGLDTLDKAMRILGEAYPGVMAANFETAINALAKEGRYGQKTGAGFYQYQPDDKGRPQRSNDPQTAELLAANQIDSADAISDQDIEDRLVLAMLLEASRCLNEGICESAEDIDTGMRLGTGFPAHFCGPLWYADNKGLDWVMNGCERFASLGGLYSADSGLIERTKNKRPFYP
jgi:3-hydroxyacyl-CoA dehydrogenase/enoyl-CoA hydratase/3-hydroxybutyryl-CoA epimerase/enoyl-CoA isomerase